MFNIDPSPEFTAAVPISRPGLAQPLDIQVTFRHKTRAQVAAWVLLAGKSDDVQHLADVIAGWSGLVDASGEAVPYSVTALTRLIENYTPARGELFRSYLSELTDAKRKN